MIHPPVLQKLGAKKNPLLTCYCCHSVMSDSLRPFGLQHAMSFTISQSLLTLMSTESVMPSNQLILCLLVGLSLLWNMFYTEVTFGGHWTHSVQFSSVAQLCLTLCDPMNHSTPGLPVPHQLPEFTQTHVH